MTSAWCAPPWCCDCHDSPSFCLQSCVSFHKDSQTKSTVQMQKISLSTFCDSSSGPSIGHHAHAVQALFIDNAIQSYPKNRSSDLLSQQRGRKPSHINTIPYRSNTSMCSMFLVGMSLTFAVIEAQQCSIASQPFDIQFRRRQAIKIHLFILPLWLDS